jgi:hypothetical protein
MDDFLILHRDKKVLQTLLCKIEDFLHENLKLNLNQKNGIFPGKQGIDFFGYPIWPTHVKLRKSTIKRAKKTKKNGPGIQNKHCNPRTR